MLLLISRQFTVMILEGFVWNFKNSFMVFVAWMWSLKDTFTVEISLFLAALQRFMVSVLDSGANGPSLGRGREHCVVFLGKTLYSHGASLHPGV